MCYTHTRSQCHSLYSKQPQQQLQFTDASQKYVPAWLDSAACRRSGQFRDPRFPPASSLRRACCLRYTQHAIQQAVQQQTAKLGRKRRQGPSVFIVRPDSQLWVSREGSGGQGRQPRLLRGRRAQSNPSPLDHSMHTRRWVTIPVHNNARTVDALTA